MLAIAYIFVYIIRFGTEDWLVKYLVEVKGNSLTLASSKLSSLALVGAFGAILAGLIPTLVIKENTNASSYMIVAVLFGVIFLGYYGPGYNAAEFIYRGF